MEFETYEGVNNTMQSNILPGAVYSLAMTRGYMGILRETERRKEEDVRYKKLGDTTQLHALTSSQSSRCFLDFLVSEKKKLDIFFLCEIKHLVF